MKFKVLRETILQPLQFVSGVVERRQTLPVLSNVLLKADEKSISFTATDLEVELVAQVDIEVKDPGDITLPARKFLDICRALPEGAMLDISIQKDRAQVKSGKSRFTLSTLPATEFPVVEEISTIKDFTLSQNELKKLIDQTQFSMAQQDVRYYLNGMMLEIQNKKLRSVATDGHRLAMCEIPIDISLKESQQVIVPRKGIQELSRLLEDTDTPVEVKVGNNHIRIQLGKVRFTSKLIDGKFPDYQRVIPSNIDKEVIAERDTLKQALTRTSILSNEKYRGVRITLENQAMRIQAHNPEQEEAEEEITIEYNGANIEIGFNVTYLLEALNVISADKVKISLSDSNSSCLITKPDSDDCKYVVMPMRL
jgi:DNA polymerase-3 subunit beta